jgi:predicted lysophospholipase L1 biosynthesis ABC-type transport system permease subunit
VLSSPVWRGTPTLAFCAGLVCGGALTALVLIVAGSLLRAPLPALGCWAVVAAALGAVLLRETGVWSFRLPENRRLVPDTVFRLGRHLGPLQFGFEMGTGARTNLPSGLPYVAAIAVALTASLPAALCAGAGFGLGRALMTTANLHYDGENGWDGEWRAHGRELKLLTGAAFVVPLAAVAVTVLSGTP